MASGHYNLGIPVLSTSHTKLVLKKDGNGIEKRTTDISARKLPSNRDYSNDKKNFKLFKKI